MSLKLWQSVHWSMVGLASWVPTWMVSRPQYCSFLQWWAQVLTLHLMERLGVQAQPPLVQLLIVCSSSNCRVRVSPEIVCAAAEILCGGTRAFSPRSPCDKK